MTVAGKTGTNRDSTPRRSVLRLMRIRVVKDIAKYLA